MIRQQIISRFLSLPATALFELTNRCNLRCKMCGIWAERPHIELKSDLVEMLVRSRTLRTLRMVGLTGGEPFLLRNFAEYVKIVRRHLPHTHINISSNGMCKERMLEMLREVDSRNLSITISYDGIDSHDAIRRVDGSKEQLLKTATAIRDEFPQVALSLKLTVTNENYMELEATARQCEQLRVPFRFKTLEKLNCHQSRSPSEIQGPAYTDEIVASIRSQARNILSMGIQTNRRYIHQLLAHHDANNQSPCNCNPRGLFFGVDGKVFLCRKMQPIGNVLDSTIDEIWRSADKELRVCEMRRCDGDPLSLSFINE